MMRAFSLFATIAIALVDPPGDRVVVSAEAAPQALHSRHPIDGDAAMPFAHAGKDGLFRVTGMRGGKAITMIVDTGATTTVLTAADAERLGIDANRGFDGALRTANGDAAIRFVEVVGLKVGGRRLASVDIAVARGPLDHSLVGLDLIARLGKLTIERDRIDLIG